MLMSNQDLKAVSSTTGTYAALKLPEQAEPGGKPASETGNKVPQEKESGPDMERLAKRLNVSMKSIGRDLRFQVDMQTGKSVIQVLDRETGEIIRQIPPENAKTYVSDSGAMALRLLDDQV